MSRKKLLITGANGLLGRSIVEWVRKNAAHKVEVFPLTRDQCDLTDFHATKAVFDYIKPDQVIHTAAVVGGIGSNTNHPGRFFCTNISINTNVLECSRIVKVKKLVSFLSTCVFPDNAPHPLKVENIHDGPPHPSNAAYAHAKRMLDVQSRAYRAEYGCNFVTVIPCNLYGKYDNYDIENGHVIPSLIHKTFLAIKNKRPLEVWGTGEPLREFIYAEDMAKIVFWVLQDYNEPDPLIVSPDEQISIKHVVELVTRFATLSISVVKDWEFTFNGELDGQLSKLSDNKEFKKFAPYDFVFTPINEGIYKTVSYFGAGFINKEHKLRGVS